MNITLVGMSGVGKTQIGRELARILKYDFLDVDDIIEERMNMKLQEIIDTYGDEKLFNLEKEIILNLGNLKDHVISPPGSVVYSDEMISFLKRNSRICYLYNTLEKISKKVTSFHNRGIIDLKKKGVRKVFEERHALYKKHCDFIADLSKMGDKEVVNYIIRNMAKL